MKELKFNGLTRAQIRAMADKIIPITMAEARSLPGMKGKIWPVQLEYNGFVDITQNGKKMFFELLK